MPSTSHPAPRAGFAAFWTFRAESTAAAANVADFLTRRTEELRRCGGFVAARIHTGLDDTTAVLRTEWADEHAYRESRPDRPELPGVLETTLFEGTPATGITGPDVHARPGIAVIATRHLAGPEAARAVLGLLAKSGEHKRHFPGFISATPYISHDGRTFLNYPTWVDEAAFRAWTADPKIAGARDEVAPLELAPPEIVVCKVVAHVTADRQEVRS